MTKDDKVAYNYARERLDNDDYPVYSDEYELECAFKAGIEYANRWISVEDELPKKDGKYLFYDEILGVQASIYYDGCTLTNSITHWMPLPEPPAKLSSLERTGKNEL